MDGLIIETLGRMAAKARLTLDRGQLDAFGRFGDLLIERNRIYNLTAIDDEYDVMFRHFWDSLSLAVHSKELSEAYAAAKSGGDGGSGGCRDGYSNEDGENGGNGGFKSGSGGGYGGEWDCNSGSGGGGVSGDVGGCRGSATCRPEIKRLVDVGAGAGFPGIPLKILFGEYLSVTLIDSIGKKADFLNELIDLLKLKGCCAIHARAEEAVGRPGMGGGFDFATARAVASLPDLLGYCMPFLTPGGVFIAMKGRLAATEQELAKPQWRRAIGKHNCVLRAITQYFICDETGRTHERTLVTVIKE